MNKYICTFGANQKHEGKYILVTASTREKAINKMNEIYGNKWCMCYSEKEWEEAWNKIPDCIPRETLLTTINVLD